MGTTHLDMLETVSTPTIKKKLTTAERAKLMCDIDALTGIFHYTMMPDDSHLKEAEEAIITYDKNH